jgi:transmembrane sensor
MEGSVLVWARDERDQAVLLHAGGELTLKPGPQLPEPKPMAVAPHLPPPELAQMAFDNEPIRSAVVRFNRVNSRKIVIADSEIGNTEIVGLFRANDPERFAQAAAAMANGTVEHEKGKIVIKLK